MGSQRHPKIKAAPQKNKTPRSRHAETIPDGTSPRRTFTPSEPDSKVVILFSRVDLDSPWCLTKIEPSHHRDVLDRVREFESMTVHEVFFRGDEPGKDYLLHDLPNQAAQERLRELRLDDRDHISRLRMSGTGRLYGLRERERFYVLWWDPDHQIWPSRKKHT